MTFDEITFYHVMSDYLIPVRFVFLCRVTISDTEMESGKIGRLKHGEPRPTLKWAFRLLPRFSVFPTTCRLHKERQLLLMGVISFHKASSASEFSKLELRHLSNPIDVFCMKPRSLLLSQPKF